MLPAVRHQPREVPRVEASLEESNLKYSLNHRLSISDRSTDTHRRNKETKIVKKIFWYVYVHLGMRGYFNITNTLVTGLLILAH